MKSLIILDVMGSLFLVFFFFFLTLANSTTQKPAVHDAGEKSVRVSCCAQKLHGSVSFVYYSRLASPLLYADNISRNSLLPNAQRGRVVW